MLCVGLSASTGGSVVEFSPATREARVRFPASAVRLANYFAGFFFIGCLVVISRKVKQCTFVLIKHWNICFDEHWNLNWLSTLILNIHTKKEF